MLLFLRITTVGVVALALVWGGFASGASAPEELRAKIDAKAKELEAINGQVQSTQQNISEAQEQSRTLKNELSQINYDINRLGLNIKASEINIQKLSLELDGLQYDIADVHASIGGKKEAIAKFLRELQQNDADNLLVVFLKNKSLADSVLTAQSLADLNQGLAVEIANLGVLYDELDTNIQLTSTKKSGIERENLNLKSRKGIVEDKRSERQSLLTQTKSREQTYQQQLAELEKKQEEIGRVIDELEHELRAAFDPSVLPLKRPGVLGKPVENGIMSQGYGATAFAQRAYKTKFHNGVDWGVPVGTPLFAAEDGVVVAVDNNDRGTSRWQKYQYGKYILIKHDNNLTTLYAHLSRQAVSRGATVKRGDLIGYSGNTGYSTGAHIHFTVYWAPSVQLKSVPPAAGLVPIGVTIDPNDYL
ncbi:MAG: peptidoglycan DD-metalloendopeptidase family protein [Candidatus Liptonbacteria bacterium]|nr:peptidoglycan DD-metalloendopeptidase family protein [Candidatus Liptonbacteria bacterium]